MSLTYLWRHGRLPNLDDPRRFTELVQARKLDDRDPRLPAMADKVAVKSIVADRLGPEWVIPTLWSGTKLPSASLWSGPVVVKSRHGCNQYAVVRDAAVDWPAVRRSSARWMKKAYGAWLDEWLYAHIPRGLLVEPFIGATEQLPVDYKIYVFAGEARYVQVHLDRATRHRWVLHDTDWKPLKTGAERIERPSALAAMLAAAEELARGLVFARVDFYQSGDRPLFGEITFYPGSGLDPFDPPALDLAMGDVWRASALAAALPDANRPIGLAAA
ncbi:hypothetical protein ASE86_06010 [Sphingomonas sp. Leaf33]|nr:hypothetical protein ASE86_06010 [Sphingomonas sp. Leaf33]